MAKEPTLSIKVAIAPGCQFPFPSYKRKVSIFTNRYRITRNRTEMENKWKIDQNLGGSISLKKRVDRIFTDTLLSTMKLHRMKPLRASINRRPFELSSSSCLPQVPSESSLNSFRDSRRAKSSISCSRADPETKEPAKTRQFYVCA